MRERDEAIQSYFLELLPDEVPLFHIFSNDLFHPARSTRQRAPQAQATPQPPPTRKNATSTSTATPQTHPLYMRSMLLQQCHRLLHKELILQHLHRNHLQRLSHLQDVP
ncbi:hypothetical protein V6N12_050935 [Hibiscus sabdariffa]|uniref:Uncharacterized protein n=1 Tax=Hibiscus sabdariffa TaxID=183260 RepID=A0ABR2GDV4_9ROSI